MKKLITTLSILMFILLFAQNSYATCEWIGGDDVWDDPANWSCGHVPGPGDDVLILGGTIALDVTTSVMALIMEGGTLTAAGETLTIISGFVWKGGTIGMKVIIASGGVADLFTPSPKVLFGELEIKGGATGTWSSGPFILDGGVLDIKTSAVFDILTDGAIADGGLGGAIFNSGIFKKTIGAGITHIHIEFFNFGSGTLLMDTGTFEFHKKFTQFGAIEVDPLEEIICHDDFLFEAGIILDGGTVTVEGALTWKDGIIDTGTFLKNADGGTMSIEGVAVKELKGTLEIWGDAVWVSSTIFSHPGSVLYIDFSGKLDVTFSATLMPVIPMSMGTFINDGIFLQSATGTIKTMHIMIPVINAGTMTVKDTLIIGELFTNSGTVEVAAPDYLALWKGSVLDVGTTLTGTGIIAMVGSTHDFDVTISCSNHLAFEGGTMNINSSLTNDNWIEIYDDATVNGTPSTSITMTGTGDLHFWEGTLAVDINIAATAFMDILSVEEKILTGILSNAGSTWLYGDAKFVMNSPGAISNSGSFDFKPGADILSTTTPGTFYNAGTTDFEGAFSTSDMSGSFTNAGLIKGIGIFDPTGIFTSSATGIVAPGFSPGELKIDTDFTIGQKLDIEVFDDSGAGTGHDKLVVGGMATLKDSLVVTETGTVPDGEYTILACTGSATCIIGTFDEVILPAGYSLNYNDSTITVTKGGALPVELISFQASPLDENVMLKWITATELNNDYFVVERSFDGRSFEKIGIVKGHGNSIESHQYQFVDENILSNSLWKTVYYRLQQTDFDGSTDFSKIIAVELEGQEKSWSVKVPTFINRNEITILYNFDEEVEMESQLVDLNGRILLHSNLYFQQGSGKIQLNTPDLQNGTYIIRLIKNEEQIIRKIIVGE